MAARPQIGHGGEVQFHFTTPKHGLQTTNRRLWELERAKERSHAAKISHQRRKAKQEDEQRRAVLQYSASPVRIVDASQLDPFVHLVMDLSFDERNQLHRYLMSVPEQVYGTGPQSAFCPVRDTTLVSVSTNEIWLSWTLLMMQQQQAGLRRRSPWDDALVLRRRQLTYELMNRKVRSEDCCLSHDTMYGLAFAALGEYRLGDVKTAQKHLEACLAIWNIRKKRGLTELTYPVGNIIYNHGFVSIGVPRYFKTLDELQRVARTATITLDAAETWNRHLRQRLKGRSDITETVSDGKTSSVNLSTLSPAFLQMYQHAFGHKSILRRQIVRSLSETTIAGIRMSLAILHRMNGVLWTCRQDAHSAIEFLQEMLHYLDRSVARDSRDGSSEAAPLMTTMGMLYTTSQCISRMQTRIPDGKVKLDLWDAIELVELLMLTSVERRKKVKQAHASWLLAEIRDPAGVVSWVEEDDVPLIDEAEATWRLGQSQIEKTDGDRDIGT